MGINIGFGIVDDKRNSVKGAPHYVTRWQHLLTIIDSGYAWKGKLKALDGRYPDFKSVLGSFPGEDGIVYTATEIATYFERLVEFIRNNEPRLPRRYTFVTPPGIPDNRAPYLDGYLDGFLIHLHDGWDNCHICEHDEWGSGFCSTGHQIDEELVARGEIRCNLASTSDLANRPLKIRKGLIDEKISYWLATEYSDLVGLRGFVAATHYDPYGELTWVITGQGKCYSYTPRTKIQRELENVDEINDYKYGTIWFDEGPVRVKILSTGAYEFYKDDLDSIVKVAEYAKTNGYSVMIRIG